MSTLKQKAKKGEGLLVGMAESIGSTLGTIAAKAKEMPEALSHSSFLKTAKREGKKVVRKSKTMAGKMEKKARSAKSSKVAKAGRRGLRRVGTAARRVKSRIG